jgi:peptidoglycan/LPS O-acetylase OafA/YrhL
MVRLAFVSSLFDGRSQYAFAVYAGACGSFPAFGLLIGVLSFERGLLSRFLSAGWLVILGEISYSIYLVHLILIRWYLPNRSMFATVPKTMLYIGYWLVVLSLSFIIWRVVEKPCQRLIRSLVRSNRDAMSLNESAPSALSLKFV